MDFATDRRRMMAAGALAAIAAQVPGHSPLGAKEKDDLNDTSTYCAMAMQLTARSLERLPDEASARAAMQEHIAEIEGAIRTSSIFVAQYTGKPVKLVVLPEYLFTSYPGRISIPDFAAKVGLPPAGRI